MRIIYRQHRCTDCGEPNPRPICECGFMRPLSDEWWVELDGGLFRFVFAPTSTLDEREAIRDALLAGDANKALRLLVAYALETAWDRE